MKTWTNLYDLVDHNGGMDRVALIDARTEPVNIRQTVVVPLADEECSQIPVAFVGSDTRRTSPPWLCFCVHRPAVGLQGNALTLRAVSDCDEKDRRRRAGREETSQ